MGLETTRDSIESDRIHADSRFAPGWVGLCGVRSQLFLCPVSLGGPVRRGGIRSAYATSILGLASGLLTNIWFLRVLTQFVAKEEFGIYAYVLQFASYLALAQLGMDFAASRQIAVSLGSGDEQEAARTYRALRWFNVRAAGIAALVVTALVVWLALRKPAPTLGSFLVPVVAALAGCSQVIVFLERPLTSVLIGSRNQVSVNVLIVGRTILTTFLAYGLLLRGWGIYSIGVAELFTHLGMWRLLQSAASRLCSWHRSVRGGRGVTEGLRALASYGLASSLGGAAWTLESTVDVVILGWLRGPAEVAGYVLWWRFPMLIFSFCTRLTESAFPYFAELHGKEIAQSRRVIEKVGVVSAGLGTLAMVGIGLWLPAFVRIWLGAAYSLPHPRFVALGMGLLVMSRVAGNFVGMFTLARGEAVTSAWVSWAQAIVKVILAVLLGLKYGLLGIIYASVLASGLQWAVLGVRLFRLGILPGVLVVRATILGGGALAMVIGLGSANMDKVGFAGLGLGIMGTAAIWAGIWLGVVIGLAGLKTVLGLVKGGVGWRSF